jgi:hypothetical protein
MGRAYLSIWWFLRPKATPLTAFSFSEWRYWSNAARRLRVELKWVQFQVATRQRSDSCSIVLGALLPK